MPEDFKQIPFAVGQASGLEELGGASPLVVNFLAEPGTDYLRTWPGTSAWSDFDAVSTTDVIGMSDWGPRLVWATKDRNWYSLEAPGFAVSLSDGTATSQIQGDGRPIFARTKSRILVAGGGVPQYWEGTGVSSRVFDAPPMTHIAALALRLVGNTTDGSGNIRFTDPFETNHLTWPELNFFEAEARPDEASAVWENANELFVWGPESLQVYVPDANVYFAPQSTITIGLSAAYSIIPLYESGGFAWLDHERNVVISNGRGAPSYPAVPAVSKTIKQLSTVSDCWAFHVEIPPYDCLVWVFPTEGRAFGFEQNGKRWFELRGHDGNEWVLWPVTSYFYWRAKGLHLVGLADGSIQQLDFTAGTQAGQAIRAKAITGFVDHGTKQRKQTIKVRVPMRRGATAVGTTEPVVELSHRDGLGAFGQPKRLGMGLAGDYKPYVEKRVVGRIYNTRQWMLDLTVSTATVIGPPEEKVELLED
jgi:hypothetical protein